jgi:hypothetical protein
MKINKFINNLIVKLDILLNSSVDLTSLDPS